MKNPLKTKKITFSVKPQPHIFGEPSLYYWAPFLIIFEPSPHIYVVPC